MGGRTWKYWASSGPVFYVCSALHCQADSGTGHLTNKALTFMHGKELFCYGNKITDYKYCTFFVSATKNFAAAAKRSVDRAKHFVVRK